MSIPGINEPLPINDDVVDKNNKLTTEWTIFWSQTLLPQVRSSQMVVDRYSNGDTPLTDALTTTIITEVLPATAVYLFLAAIQILVAAGVSSDVSLTLTWTSNGVVQQETFGPITNGGTTDHLGVSYAILADSGTPVSISTTYASNPANAMAYNIGASLNINGLPGDTA